MHARRTYARIVITAVVVGDEEPFLAVGAGNVAGSRAPGAAAVCVRNDGEVDQ